MSTGLATAYHSLLICNSISFTADITGDKEIQVYSDSIPNRILKNGTVLQNVSSYPQLISNSWFYNPSENKIYMKVNPVVTTTTTTTSTTTTTIGPLSYTYVVYKSGSDTCMRDGTTGTPIACDTSSSYIINRAITDASSIGGGSILVENGDYSLSDNIDMKSNAKVVLQLDVTFTVTSWNPTSRQGILDFRSIINAHFVTETEPADESEYPKVMGGGASNECGVWMGGSSSIRTTNCSVGKIAFSNIGGYGIGLKYADHNELNGTYVHGFAKGGVYKHGTTLRGYTSYNKLINLHIDGEHGTNTEHPLYFGGEGPVTYNEVLGGIYENSLVSHAIYWCTEGNATIPGDSHYGWFVDHNTAIGGISRGCRGSNYACGFKLNSATNSIINWTIIDCSLGVAMGDGNKNSGGNHGNVVRAKIWNCNNGIEMFVQSSGMHTQNNDVHLDVDVDTVNYPVTGPVGNMAFRFTWNTGVVDSHVQYNTIDLKARNYQHGVVFTPYNVPMHETMEGRNNIFNLDVDVANGYAIYWMPGCGEYGRYNTFNGYWHSNLAGNCSSVPNADYVRSSVGCDVVATNTFNPGIP